jgi:uncharacterized protein (TIGR02611 family)
MLAKLRRSWRSLKDAPAGERFRRYHRQHSDSGRPAWKRVAWIVGGVVVIAAGIIALPAPGPGTLVIVAGFALLGRELAVVARALDWLEATLRRGVAALRRTWRGASPMGRVGLAGLAGLLGLVLLAGAGWAAYRLVLGG